MHTCTHAVSHTQIHAESYMTPTHTHTRRAHQARALPCTLTRPLPELRGRHLHPGGSGSGHTWRPSGKPRSCPQSPDVGTCPGDTWATDGHENSGPAPPSKVLAPWPLASSRQHPYSGTRKGRSREAESSTRRQAALVFRGLWGAESPSPKAPLREYSYCPQDQRDICLPGACGPGAGLGRGVCRQRGSI